jgi:hypothetical protein
MFCANVLLYSTLLRNYFDENSFQTSELQGPHVKSHEKFSVQLYCSVNDVVLEAGELCKMRSLRTCALHRVEHFMDDKVKDTEMGGVVLTTRKRKFNKEF